MSSTADGPMLLVGQVLVDVSRPLDTDGGLRLGGVIHSARMAWALGREFAVAYIAPAFAKGLVERYLESLDCSATWQIGEVVGSPNVILIPEPTEAGPQGYDLLLDGERHVLLDDAAAAGAFNSSWSSALLFPDRTDVDALAAHVPADRLEDVYVDSSLPLDALTAFRGCSFITSASQATCAELDPPEIASEALSDGFAMALVKENRGGARLWRTDRSSIQVGATLGPIVHSVGVGDAFDVAFIAGRSSSGDECALQRASALAWAYASTTNPVTLRRLVASIEADSLDAEHEYGTCLPWEDRPAIHVYLAAPDFDWVDTHLLDAVDAALQYHNFSTHRPVAEHGQVEPRNDSPAALRETFLRDMALLDRCQVIVAVLLHDDPGTIAEVGWSVARGKPVVLYDPHARAENLMLTHLPDNVVRTLNDLVAAVYDHAARL